MTKQQVLDTLLLEMRVCRKLYKEMSMEHADYRPTEGQRSTIELLRYLACQFMGFADNFVNGGWEYWKQRGEELKEMPWADFEQHMQRQEEELTALVQGLTDEQWNTQRAEDTPWKANAPLNVEFGGTLLRFAAGYRMQLFLYAKACGASHLGTTDCWFAVD